MNFYPYQIFKNWGANPEAETQSEVWFALLTPSSSIPFMREFGSLIPTFLNNPDQANILNLMKISITFSLAKLSEVSPPSRQALTDFTWITINDLGDGDENVNVTYVRLANRQLVPLSI